MSSFPNLDNTNLWHAFGADRAPKPRTKRPKAAKSTPIERKAWFRSPEHSTWTGGWVAAEPVGEELEEFTDLTSINLWMEALWP